MLANMCASEDDEVRLSEATITELSRTEAEDFLMAHEHLGNVGLGVWHFGLVCRGELLSVVCLGPPCFAGGRSFLGRIAREQDFRVIQLCRGATHPSAPPNTGSRVISLTRKHVYRNGGATAIVAYADPRMNERGAIYQAAGAIYLGKTSPKGQADYIVFGKKMTAWQVRRKWGTRARVKLRRIDPQARVLPLHPKHRYVFLAGSPRSVRAFRRRLSRWQAPYPKTLSESSP